MKNDKPLKVAIIFGGKSSEYEVSLKTVSSVLANIDTKKYEIIAIGISKEGQWYLYSGPYENIITDSWQIPRFTRSAIISPDCSKKGIYILQNDQSYQFVGVDILFPVLHGKNGEDGTIQGIFELSGIPYVGCGLISSANCMDKEITHTLLESASIKMTKWISFRKPELDDFESIRQKVTSTFDYPVFVKPANAGSSVGVSKVGDDSDLRRALEIAFEQDKKVVVEKAVIGREVECAVLGNDEPMASVLGEIAPEVEFYDYDAKYKSGTTKLHIPARIDDSISEKVKAIAVKAYRTMECSGLSRVDFFVCDDGEIILNEINTLPGFTEISMYPKLMEATGIPYTDLIDKLITLGFERDGQLGK